MSIKKIDNKFYVDIRPYENTNKRIRKTFITKSEAVRFQNHILAEAQTKPWNGEKEDKRRLSQLIEKWYEFHGQTLAVPEKSLAKLKAICEDLNDPIAAKLTATDYIEYRGKRLKKIKPKTANNDLNLIRGLFNKLIEIDNIKYPNPIASIKLIKVQETELVFLSEQEINILLEELKLSTNPHVNIVARICLSTGCRISESFGLKRTNVIKSGNEFRINFVNTKSKKRRTVPISENLYNEIPKKSGALFADCRKAFERAIRKTEIVLPEGQCSHVLRHTFASHFMMNGGNIIVLQRILGHAKIEETMRYAHFAPNHLEDAIRLNPLANCP